MAPLLHILSLLVLSTLALASPHVSRHLHGRHALRPVSPHLNVPDVSSVPIPKRKRSLNKRCIPPSSNFTSSALPSSTLPSSALTSSTAPVNVAPVPSLASSSLPSSSPVLASVPDSSSTPTTSPTPTTSSTPYVPPSSSEAATSSTPTPTPTPTPTTTSAAATSSPTNTSGEPYYMVGTQHGDGTYYDAGLGACGIDNSDNQHIVAVSHLLFDSYPDYDGVNPNTNPVCGKSVTISYGGNSVTATVTDRCVACAETDLDMTPTAFSELAALSVGRIQMSWIWS